MNYKAYPTRKIEKSRKNRKHARNTIFINNRSLNSKRTKEGVKEKEQ
jgi:hypothetical protein